MRSGQFFSGIRAFMGKLKWSDYWNEILHSIAEEEIRIRRVEYHSHIDGHERGAPLPERTGQRAPD